MPATRTQVYLSDEQRARIDEAAQSDGVTMAEVIRRAIDSYFDREFPASGPALDATFGAVPDAVAPDRDEWARG